MITVVLRVARDFDVIQLKLTKAVAKRVERLVGQDKCLACECALVAGAKTVSGCCMSCAQSQYYAIRKGHTTLQQLIRNGERLAPKTPGRKPRGAYSAKLLGREAEDNSNG
jgi:hypothetical protein